MKKRTYYQWKTMPPANVVDIVNTINSDKTVLQASKVIERKYGLKLSQSTIYKIHGHRHLTVEEIYQRHCNQTERPATNESEIIAYINNHSIEDLNAIIALCKCPIDEDCLVAIYDRTKLVAPIKVIADIRKAVYLPLNKRLLELSIESGTEKELGIEKPVINGKFSLEEMKYYYSLLPDNVSENDVKTAYKYSPEARQIVNLYHLINQSILLESIPLKLDVQNKYLSMISSNLAKLVQLWEGKPVL